MRSKCSMRQYMSCINFMKEKKMTPKIKIMKNHPILFKPEMVNAILTGQKTVTRRVITENNIQSTAYLHDLVMRDAINDTGWFGSDIHYLKLPHKSGDGTRHRVMPKWLAGDRLWIRETWKWEGDTKWDDAMPIGSFYYKADFPDGDGPTGWKPSIHMPKKACRLWQEVVAVRPERLQEITDKDAIKEGVSFDNESGFYFASDQFMGQQPKEVFRKLWDSINATPKLVKTNPHTGVKEDCYVSYPWEDISQVETIHNLTHYIIGNPWVWRVEFKVISNEWE